MTVFDSLRMKVLKDARKEQPNVFDGLALSGFAITFLILVISAVVYFTAGEAERETIFLAKHVHWFVNYGIVHFIFLCLYARAEDNVAKIRTKYSELSDDEYEKVTLASIYSIIIAALTPVTYVYLLIKYTFAGIGAIFEIGFIDIPEFLVHKLFGRKVEKPKEQVKEVKPEKPENADILSDYNAFLNK